MNLRKVKKAYKETGIDTAPVIDVKIKLLQSSLIYLNKAIFSIKFEDSVARNENLKKAQQFILECIPLMNQNYPDNKNIIELYIYINNRLIEANIKSDIQNVEEISDIIEQLLIAWGEAKLQKGRIRDFI